MYFFRGVWYTNIQVNPGSLTDKVTSGPSKFAVNWDTLVKAGFDTVDAVVPVPDRKNEAYFFSGTRYVRIRYVPGTYKEDIVFGPKRIVDEWKTLAKAEFDTVDAVLPVPGQKNKAYFFSGNKYAQIRFAPDSPDEEIVFGPKRIVDEWKTLGQAGFDTIDAVIPVPGFEKQAYFFSGSQYVRIQFEPNAAEPEKIITPPTRIATKWKSLASWGW
jgi:hypothetical protein